MVKELESTEDKPTGDTAVVERVKVVQNVMIAMRDGIRLATDVYLPIDGKAKRAAVLE